LIAVSLLDDRFQVAIGIRLAVQVLAAAYWIWVSGPVVGGVGAFLAILWATNLYNFMDGSDGLAGLMTVSGFTAYAVAAWLAGSTAAAMLFALVAATLPFLRRNLPPATVFMGDTGAVPLGFLAAVVGIEGIGTGLWPLWFPLLVFLPFIADASVTLTRRALRGERIWRAHREHYYQRLVQLGLGHSGALALYAALMVGTGTSALAALTRAPAAGMTLLGMWAVVHLLAFSVIDHAWRRSENGIDASKC
jgi:UDP-N-acetylmuramyl pentapeptide phosphotransferase/UDP-N-acetylglucosamine-1-phosphate transferase